MAGITIGGSTLTTDLLATDQLPMHRPGDSTARHTRLDDLGNYLLDSSQTRLYSSSAISATDVTVNSLPSGIAVNQSYILIDAYTIDAELRKITGISGNTISFSGGLAYAHIATDAVLFLPNQAVHAFWFGAKYDGSTDDATAHNRMFTQSPYCILPPGTSRNLSSLTPGATTHIEGAGILRTILYFPGLADVCMYCPTGRSRLDGFSITGNDTAGSIGILANDTYPMNSCNWGEIRIDSLKIGLQIQPTSQGMYYNNIDVLRINNCNTTGLDIDVQPGATQNFGASNFGLVSITNGGVGLYFDTPGRVSFGFLEIEGNSSTALHYVQGSPIILGGHIEGNGAGILIDNYPSAMGGFTYFGSVDLTDPDPLTYTYNASRGSYLLPDANRTFTFVLGGHWMAEEFEFINSVSPGLKNPNVTGLSLYRSYANTGATPSCNGANLLSLEYTVSTEITSITGATAQGHILIIYATNANAYINDGGNFYLTANWVPVGSRDNITLFADGSGHWIEISRSMVV